MHQLEDKEPQAGGARTQRFDLLVPVFIIEEELCERAMVSEGALGK